MCVTDLKKFRTSANGWDIADCYHMLYVRQGVLWTCGIAGANHIVQVSVRDACAPYGSNFELQVM